MTVRVSKPEFNLRDKLSELDKPVGLKGSELMRSETTEDVRNLINAGRKNIMINGAMQVYQYGSPLSVEGYVCDRWNYLRSGVNEELTLSAESLSSSDLGPWEAGFRNYLKVTNGNQTGGAGASDYGIIRYKVEAQDLANCGWDYTLGNNYITFSYWIRSSVPQNFYHYMRSHDGTAQLYTWETGTLVKNVWKKIIVTLPGDSRLTINDDNGMGMLITIPLFWGTTWTDNGAGLNRWRAWGSGNARTPDYDTSFWTTNDAELSVVGFQLEVGSQATPFEFRSYAEELARCQRYYMKRNLYGCCSTGFSQSGGGYNSHLMNIPLPVKMRQTPTVTFDNATQSGAFQPGGDTADFQSFANGTDFVSVTTGSTNSTWTTQVVSNSNPNINLNAEL